MAIIEDALKKGAPKVYNKPYAPPYTNRVSMPVSLGRAQREKKLKPKTF